MRNRFLIAAVTCAIAVITPLALRSESPAPKYEVDRAWPKPFPDRWVIGGLGGVCVDLHDHVFLLNRQDVPEIDLNSGHLAPAIIEIDTEGNLVNSWSAPQSLDPRLHSCYFDKDNNMWIASSPSGMVQKYSHDGSKLLMQIGKRACSIRPTALKRASRSIQTRRNSLCPLASLPIPKTVTCMLPMARVRVGIGASL